MEMIKSRYTLEEHLKFLSDLNDDFKSLYSIWNLNKKELSPALSHIAVNFPNFSDHSVRHSNNIIMYLECYLGENRIKELGAVDTFMMLMASYVHDIGMILWFTKILEIWKDKKIKEHIKYISENSDKQMSAAAQLLIHILDSDDKENAKLKDINNILEIWNAVTLINVELTRSSHALRSKEYIIKSEEYLELFNNFHMQSLPKRILICLSEIAEMHNRNFDDLFLLLEHSATLYGDEFHPRFIACMLRLGDLLDFDNGRFSLISIKQIKEMPDTSKNEYLKHESVTHMYISPTAIEATLICYDDKVYRAARRWFDCLEIEVKNQSLSWTKIAPPDLSGLPPVIDRDAIKIKMQKFEVDKDLLNLKFNIKTKKAFQLIHGGGIYENPSCDFLREIVQNAYDATKLQIWKDWNNGYNLEYIKECDNDDFKKHLSFSNQMKMEIFNLYPIKLSLSWEEKKNTANKLLVIECEDKGTGISKNALLRMTENVGDSYSVDADYSKYTDNIPYWLKPTGAFGIGLQSIFLVASEFIIETSYPGEISRKILFRSSSNADPYCSIIDQGFERKRGTKITIKIDIENYEDKYPSYDLGLIFNHDFISNDYDSLCLEKIEVYIRRQLNDIPSIILEINGFPNKLHSRQIDNEDNWKEIKTAKDNDKFQYFTKKKTQNTDPLQFRIVENELGSIFYFRFYSNICNSENYNNRFFLRNIPINNVSWNYYLTSYVIFEWNLLNQETDKFLNLSRDKLLSEGSSNLYNFLINKLFPNIYSNFKELNIIKLLITDNQYSAFYITMQILGVFNKEYAKEIDIREELKNRKDYDCSILQKGGEQVSNYDILNMEKYFLIKNKRGKVVINSDAKKEENENLIKKVIEDHNDLGDEILITENSLLNTYLLLSFHKKKIIDINPEYDLYQYEKNNGTDIQLLEFENDSILKEYLRSQFTTKESGIGYRELLPPIEKYKQIIVPTNICGGDFISQRNTICIISPFYREFSIDILKKQFDDLSIKGVSFYLKENNILPNEMLNKIIKYNILGNCKKRRRLLQQNRSCCYSSEVAKLMFFS